MRFGSIKRKMKKIAAKRPSSHGERGYALVGIMAVMLFSLIMMSAAAPMVKFEAQREREEEMLWRGQQVAAGLARYAAMRGGQYPTDLNQLVEGIEVGVKKIRLLRPSALCDPMTPCDAGSSNWRLVRPGDPLVKELLDAYVSTQQKGQMVLPPPPPNLVAFAQMGATKLPGQNPDTKLDGNLGGMTGQVGGANSGGDDSEEFGKGAIIGVVSKKSDKMFRSYFGIDQYDHSLFFPGVPVLAGGFINPIAFGVIMGSGGSGNNTADAQNNPCPKGGVFIDGKCWGVLIPGKNCRGPNGETIPCPGS